MTLDDRPPGTRQLGLRRFDRCWFVTAVDDPGARSLRAAQYAAGIAPD